ncbi:hypothetical protein [Pseudomonas sp. NPDC089396]|uniref:hypothetical protein n=1 Tax=Pseudomonas sp. NPDC089396 TaxID=3364461 RepID=UPI003838284C
MKLPFNKFFKAQSQKLAYEMAFFSITHLDEDHDFSESGSYLVMIGLDPAKMIMLTVGGVDFTFTTAQANALGSKLLELASTGGSETPTI